MANLRALLSLVLLPLAACGNDSATPDAPPAIDAAPDAPAIDGPPDAPAYDLSCYQNAEPTTATTTITVAGTAQEAYLNGTMPDVRAASGVTIQACTGNCQGPNDLGSVGPTPANGTFVSPSAATGDVPLAAYLIATKTGNRTTYVYPASPLVMNQVGVPVFMLTESLIPLLSFVGIDQMAGNSMMAVFVTDCASPPNGIAGATVTVTQSGSPAGDAPIDASSIDPRGTGAWFVTNVPPGDTTVSATYNGMTFRAHVVGATANTLTTTQVKPGY